MVMKKKSITASLIIMIVGALISVGITQLFSDGNVMDKKLTSMSHEERADELLAEMTIEEKVGQMFMGCFYSYTPSADTVRSYNLGGILLFTPSFESTPKPQLTAKLAAMDGVCNIAPVTAVDEEGGDVVRVSASKYYRSTPFKSARELFATGGMDAIVADAHEKNKLLKETGIEMNLAPVCDISTNPNDFMYPRSLGQNPQITAEYVERVVAACEEDGIACSLKHFPGYGNAVDTHYGEAVDKRSLQQIKENDMVPFTAGIDAGVDSILVSHNIVTAIDSTLPASLSPAINKIIREDLSYDGIIITDDLIMGAVTEYGSEEEVAVAAVLAGNDILCTGHFKTQVPAVINAVKNEVISEERINESVKRILMLKLKLGVIS